MFHIDLDSDMEQPKVLRKVKCPRPECGNIWDTGSEKHLVSCPKCFYKLRIKNCLTK